MAERRRHSQRETASKLAEADDLANQGKLQNDIANTLGISVMTLHRWRKSRPKPVMTAVNEPEEFEPKLPRDQQLSELQHENSRLRRLVIDLLLEKTELQETANRSGPQKKLRRSSSAH